MGGGNYEVQGRKWDVISWKYLSPSLIVMVVQHTGHSGQSSEVLAPGHVTGDDGNSGQSSSGRPKR